MLMPRIQFTIRNALVAILIISVLLAIYSERSLRQRRVAINLINLGGIPIYSVKLGTSLDQQSLATESDFWRHFVYSIDTMILQPNSQHPADAQLQVAAQMQRLRELYVWPGGADGFQPSSRAAPGGITDEGVRILITQLSHLDAFGTTSANVSDKKLAELDKVMDKARTLIVLPPKGNNKQSFINRQP